MTEDKIVITLTVSKSEIGQCPKAKSNAGRIRKRCRWPENSRGGTREGAGRKARKEVHDGQNNMQSK